MDMYIGILIKLKIGYLQRIGYPANIADCSRSGFFHHVTERAGECDLTRSGHSNSLYRKHLSTNRRPGKSVDGTYLTHTDVIVLLEFMRSEKAHQIVGFYGNLRGLTVSNRHGTLTADRSKFLFKSADTGLTSIMVDQAINRVIGYLTLRSGQTVGLELLFNQMSLCYVELVFSCIA